MRIVKQNYITRTEVTSTGITITFTRCCTSEFNVFLNKKENIENFVKFIGNNTLYYFINVNTYKSKNTHKYNITIKSTNFKILNEISNMNNLITYFQRAYKQKLESLRLAGYKEYLNKTNFTVLEPLFETKNGVIAVKFENSNLPVKKLQF